MQDTTNTARTRHINTTQHSTSNRSLSQQTHARTHARTHAACTRTRAHVTPTHEPPSAHAHTGRNIEFTEARQLVEALGLGNEVEAGAATESAGSGDGGAGCCAGH